MSIGEQTIETQTSKQYDDYDKNHSLNWGVDEKDVIVIGRAKSTGGREEASSIERESAAAKEAGVQRAYQANEPRVIEQTDEELNRGQDDEDDEAVPFPRMHKIIFFFCVIGFVVLVLYILNYWGIISLPW